MSDDKLRMLKIYFTSRSARENGIWNIQLECHGYILMESVAMWLVCMQLCYKAWISYVHFLQGRREGGFHGFRKPPFKISTQHEFPLIFSEYN